MNNLTIGILLTDHVLEDLKTKHGDQDDFYYKIFNEADKSIKLKIYDVTKNTYPDDINECNGYLITGSKLSVYDDVHWIRELEEYIRYLNSAEKKLLGVCFGHQLIAKALGGSVRKATAGWVTGLQSYNVHAFFPWVDSFDEEIIVVQIAGLIARRIVTECSKDDQLDQGSRIGMIRFGSRADIYFENYKPLVKLEQKSLAGETLLAKR